MDKIIRLQDFDHQSQQIFGLHEPSSLYDEGSHYKFVFSTLGLTLMNPGDSLNLIKTQSKFSIQP